MKRRSFFQVAAVAPPLAAAAAQAPTSTAGGPESPTAARAVEITAADSVCHPKTGFFTKVQFSTLRRLSELLWPPKDETPGALEAGAPEFLDFLIGASPASTKQLYRTGLDALDQRAHAKFGKTFADLAPADADKLLSSLNEPWKPNPPSDPVARFLQRAKLDVYNATVNSREYSLKVSSTRRSAAGIGQYWHSLD